MKRTRGAEKRARAIDAASDPSTARPPASSSRATGKRPRNAAEAARVAELARLSAEQLADLDGPGTKPARRGSSTAKQGRNVAGADARIAVTSQRWRPVAPGRMRSIEGGALYDGRTTNLLIGSRDFATWQAGERRARAAIAASAAIASAEVVIIAGAFASVGKAISEATALYREWDSAAIKKASYAEGSAGAENVHGIHSVSQDEAASTHAKFLASQAAAAGSGTGKALADGITAGMADGSPAVAAGAAKMITVANASARAAADAHSPSELMRRGVGKDLGTGVAAGMDDQADNVQAAAERSLVPTPPKGIGAGGGQSGASSGPIQVHQHFHFPGITSGKREEFERAAGDPFRAGLRELTFALGLSIPT
jgi:hypothetical protein